jgi:hypothetical protein
MHTRTRGWGSYGEDSEGLFVLVEGLGKCLVWRALVVNVNNEMVSIHLTGSMQPLGHFRCVYRPLTYSFCAFWLVCAQ